MCVGGVRRWVSGRGRKGNCTNIPANMAEEEVAKLIVGNDSARPVLLVTCHGCFH